MGDRYDAQLACDALSAAVAARGRPRMDGVIMHTDREPAQYTSAAFTRRLRPAGDPSARCSGCAACAAAIMQSVQDTFGARRSMSRAGSCLGNAVAESFLAT